MFKAVGLRAVVAVAVVVSGVKQKNLSAAPFRSVNAVGGRRNLFVRQSAAAVSVLFHDNISRYYCVRGCPGQQGDFVIRYELYGIDGIRYVKLK